MLTQQQIIKAIRNSYRQREPLNITEVKRRHPELIQAVYCVKPFWGWKAALQDAGIDYAKIKIELEETITCELCGKSWRNLSVHLIKKHEVRPDEYRMDYPESALICEAVRAYRLHKEKPPIRHWEPCWSPEYVLDRVVEYHRQGYPMRIGKFTNVDDSLIKAAVRYWGGWREALIAVGLEPRKLTRETYRRLRKYPSKESVVQEIKRRLKKGLLVSPGSLRRPHGKIRSDTGLFFNGIEYFGSWENALKSAGVDPHVVIKPKRKYPTKQDVIHEIRARHKRKWAINHSDMHQGANQDSALGHWAGKYFGSWKEALRAAGFDPAKIYRQAQLRHLKYPNEKAVLRAIKQRVREKRLLNYWGVAFGHNRDFPLVLRASRFFGSWNNALKKAGLDPYKIKHDALSRAASKRWPK